MVALVLCAGIGGYWFVSNQVAKYTSETPVKLPTVEFTPEQLVELEDRLARFKTTIDEGNTPEEDLVLTAEEINALIGKEEKLRGRVFVKIEDGQVTGDLSVPTDVLPGGKGRFFNGSATFDVSMEGGVLIVTLADAEVNGEPVPQQVVDGMSRENLAKDLYKDPQNAKFIRRVESVSVEDDKIILKFRRDETTAEETTAEQTETGSTPSEQEPTPPGDDGSVQAEIDS
jgi:hypothetical protein